MDISLCTNFKCCKKENCLRYLATPSDYQSYTKFDNKDNNCQFYIEMKQDKEK